LQTTKTATKFSIERRVTPSDRPNGADIGNAELMNAIEALSETVAGLRAGNRPAGGDGYGVDQEGDQDLRIELAQMVRTIARAKTEIASIKHPMSEDDQMVDATSELDEIVKATENATNTILESGEQIERVIDETKEAHGGDEAIQLLCDQIGSQVVNIFQACNFQDITGQRITKVVRTLRFVEARILAMIEIWGAGAFQDLPVPGPPPAHSSDEHVKGPQLENQGISQAEIDALFD
jgi:chemotaxis protein CheZ